MAAVCTFRGNRCFYLFNYYILFNYLFTVAEDFYFVDYIISIWRTQSYKLSKIVLHSKSYGNSVKNSEFWIKYFRRSEIILMFMCEFKICPNFIYTRSLSSMDNLFALSRLHFKFDFVWSTIVFAEK